MAIGAKRLDIWIDCNKWFLTQSKGNQISYDDFNFKSKGEIKLIVDLGKKCFWSKQLVTF